MPQYNYSIIIPHKEIPELLMRCLRSIPDRDDVQVIVVDDNSKDAETYLERFPELSRSNLELYLTKEGKGAGYARNVGLDHAKGKWLLFADADDLFSEDIDEIMTENLNKQVDVVYFDVTGRMSDDITMPSKRTDFLRIASFPNNGTIRYLHITPWGKIIDAAFAKKNNIRFQEIKWSNDVFFATSVGVLAKKISVSKSVMYIVTEREGSLAIHNKRSRLELVTRARAGIDAYLIARENGYKGTASWIEELFKHGLYFDFMKALQEIRISSYYEIYCKAIWGSNKRKQLFLRLLMLTSFILPLPRLSKI